MQHGDAPIQGSNMDYHHWMSDVSALCFMCPRLFKSVMLTCPALNALQKRRPVCRSTQYILPNETSSACKATMSQSPIHKTTFLKNSNACLRKLHRPRKTHDGVIQLPIMQRPLHQTKPTLHVLYGLPKWSSICFNHRTLA